MVIYWHLENFYSLLAKFGSQFRLHFKPQAFNLRNCAFRKQLVAGIQVGKALPKKQIKSQVKSLAPNT